MNYAYWLATVPGISNRVRLHLWKEAGSAEALYGMTERQLRELQGVSDALAQRITEDHRRDTQAAYAALGARGIDFFSIEDERYPRRLREIADAPYALYGKGKVWQERRAVAIVGARQCSEYGRQLAFRIAERLAEQGICVVSGMAQGVDRAGHEGALAAGGVTCAVLGCGVDICYPMSSRRLFDSIPDRGCLLSEYPPRTEPKPYFFPQRNRIIAGLAELTIVVEAREKSGSLITADCALEQGKDVYAVPGRVTDPLSGGCNRLIRQGAGIVLSVDDLLRELSICGFREDRHAGTENLSLEKEERLVYSCVDLRPTSMEELLQRTGLTLPALAEILTGLEKRGFVLETFKNCYVRRM